MWGDLFMEKIAGGRCARGAILKRESPRTEREAQGSARYPRSIERSAVYRPNVRPKATRANHGP